jgi:hypothetical protein
VIRQASETQAPKLRSLAPSLDRDLETICARCLERDPKARYQSAGDLAADLERWLTGRPIVARPVSPPVQIWRWSRRNPKLVGAATAGLLLGAAAVSLLRGELFRASRFSPGGKNIAVSPFSDVSETKDHGSKRAVRASAHDEPGNGVYSPYLQRLFADVTHPTEISSTGISGAVHSPSNPFTVPDYTSAGGFDLSGPETRVTPSPPVTGSTTNMGDRASEAARPTTKIAADVTAASPVTRVTTSARDRALEAPRPTTKITAGVTPAPAGTTITTSVRDHTLETSLRTNKVTVDGQASIQGFVKDSKGEPIRGADLRIESRDGKQVFSTAKTDAKGRYISQGLQPGVYRVTLLVNGAVKAAIMNTQTKLNQPTQLNFDFKSTSQAGTIAKSRKHMVWMPNRTGTHLGGNWVEVDDEGNAHFDSNSQTYNVPR